MSLIEGIGDEVTHFFIGLLVVIVVLVAWWTTGITEQRYVQTVLLLDRRRIRPSRRLTNHTHTLTVSEGSSSSPTPFPDSDNTPTRETTNPPTMDLPSANNKPPEEATSSSSKEPEPPIEERSEEEEEQFRIVETMDTDACVLRHRRLQFYNRNATNDSENENKPPETNQEGDRKTEETTNIMEHNYAEREQEQPTQEAASPSTEITIKLKYINDDLKIVSGDLEERLGDFKRRHFQPELTSNKLVRLIFNGQVLHQDHRTLQNCGLFDNCVVHCLIHQNRNVGSGNQSDTTDNMSNSSNNNNLNANNNNNQGRDWDLGNFLFAIISFSLLSAWYFRYVYAHLYTATATVGLVLMTGVFSIVLIGAYFPDTERLQPLRNRNNL